MTKPKIFKINLIYKQLLMILIMLANMTFSLKINLSMIWIFSQFKIFNKLIIINKVMKNNHNDFKYKVKKVSHQNVIK